MMKRFLTRMILMGSVLLICPAIAYADVIAEPVIERQLSRLTPVIWIAALVAVTAGLIWLIRKKKR